MSKPIKTSGETDAGRKKRRWYSAFSGNAFLFTVLLHVFFGILAAFLIVEHFQKKHVDFQAVATQDHTEVEHKVEMAKRNSVESAPQDVKRIVTTDVSAITLPEVPDVPPPDDVTPSAMAGLGGEGLMGDGNGGNGTGDGGGGVDLPVFGGQSGPGFEGTIYDLKIGPDHQPTNITDPKYMQVLSDFVHSGWGQDVLYPYYKASKKLYTPAIWIPTVPSPSTATAMGLNGELTATMWVGWYKATVKAPKTGRYHFVGFGDDILVVAVNGQVVLDASLWPVLDRAQRMPWPYSDWNVICPFKGQNYGKLRVGDSFDADTAEPLKIDVILGDKPGGDYNAFLMIADDSETYPIGPQGVPLYPIFQIGSGTINRSGDQPPHSTTQEPWTAVLPDATEGTTP